MHGTSANTFLHGSLPLTYAKTALPIIFVMGMNGLLAVADALFLGHYVGQSALAAVTLVFPIYMLIVALSTLVSSGMSSLLARHLGAGRLENARAVFAGAHGLAGMTGIILIVLFSFLGRQLTLMSSAGAQELAQLGYIYLRITVLMSPLLFILSVNSDALRNEGRVGFMAAMSLLVSLANICFNYVLIAKLHLGVAGSAYGTASAQALALGIILIFRLRGRTVLGLKSIKIRNLSKVWGKILALGAPQSLNFIGLSLGSATIIAALQLVETPNYDHTVAAYGIITRVMTFVFLPLLGLSQAMQTITGNNFGAGLWVRSNNSLRFALCASFIYCLTMQIILMVFPTEIAQAFVNDPATVAEVTRILPIMTIAFMISGPLMIIAMHFQAIGNAPLAGLLGLSKPYLFAIPLTLILGLSFGEIGIWIAGPVAEICLLILTAVVLSHLARQNRQHWGLFANTPYGEA